MMVKTRIAPSPTGDPHVGTAYIALFNYCFARRHGGKFILRIEDTDQTRSAPEHEAAIMEALRWLGIQWDEGPDVGGPSGPYRQSERQKIYKEHADLLVDKGAAYRCFCTADRLDKMRQRQIALKKPTGYDGLCRSLPEEEVRRNVEAGTPFVVRLKMPQEGETVIPDGLRGDIRYPNAQLDDQVLLKSDGFPTYHLANVVDDHLMGITHVIRAEEWIPSTPKHLKLYEAFGWQRPEFYHMPLLRNKDKSKISKRKNPTSIGYYEKIGILPEAMRNFLALIGYSFGADREKVTLDEMIADFDLKRVSLGEPVFDLEKLFWLNGQYIREMSPDTLHQRIMSLVLDPAYIRHIVPLLQERIERLMDFVPMSSFFFGAPLEYDPQSLLVKGVVPSELSRILSEVGEELDGLKAWTTPNLEALLRTYCEKTGIKSKILFMPVRIAVTGRKASPPLFESMELIGKPLCQQRLREAVHKLKTLPDPQPQPPAQA